ncbi:MAG TPA: cupin domain-containing protein [Chthoniobacterales bacterium]|nr:cupin domain-containing protein [Chthoniobacterales bacterium]
MKKVNISEIKEEPWQSPKDRFAVAFKGISEALGRDRDSLDLTKRWPFDLELNRMPPGKPNFPYHSHSAQWEMYLVVSGNGTVRDKNGETKVVAGDAFIFGPNEPHQIINSGNVDLVYYVIADNPIGESGYYPDSNKWLVRSPERRLLRSESLDYFDGEE